MRGSQTKTLSNGSSNVCQIALLQSASRVRLFVQTAFMVHASEQACEWHQDGYLVLNIFSKQSYFPPLGGGAIPLPPHRGEEVLSFLAREERRKPLPFKGGEACGSVSRVAGLALDKSSHRV